MGIFIQGKTTCAICCRAIEHRSAAAQLPYVKPGSVSSPDLQTRPFVHRKCWNEWDERDAVCSSALALLRDSDGADDVRSLLYAANGIALERWKAGFVRIHDIWTLVTLDLPFGELMNFRRYLSGLTEGESLIMGTIEIQIIRPDPVGDITLNAVDSAGEVIWSAELTAERRADWLTALESGTA